MLKPEDEVTHTPGPAADWQENYLFHGWDADFKTGFYLHLQYIAAKGLVDVRAGAAIDGELTTHVVEREGKNAFDVPGLEIDVVDPFKRIRMRYASTGHSGPDDAGWYFIGQGDEAFGFDIEMSSIMAPVNWLDFTPKFFPDDATGQLTTAQHFELGGIWTGSVWRGTKKTTAKGLYWRDHSWGGRSFKSDTTLWTPMVLDDGNVFVSTLATLHQGKWRAFAAESHADGRQIQMPDYWARIDGVMEPGGFASASSIGIDGSKAVRYDFTAKRFLKAPRNWTVSGKPNRGLVDVVSTVQSSGRSGIGTMQFSPYVVPSEEDGG